jgi:AAA+ ATPase superfamily predicted ATPase
MFFQKASIDREDIFVGREDIINKVISRQSNFLIFGARRIGKTSLLKELKKRFSENDVSLFISPCKVIQNRKK